MRINLRVNDIKDKDIVDALWNVKDKTKAVKSLIRKGLMPQQTQPIVLEDVYIKEECIEVDDGDVLENLFSSTPTFE